MEEETPFTPTRKRCILLIRPPRAWTPDEDARLQRLAVEHGYCRWHRVARQMPGRSPRSCRDRWRHHLARDVYHRPFTARDDEELARLHQRLGDRWKDIGRAVYGRSSRIMRRRWREISKKAKNGGGNSKTHYCPPLLPSEDMESEPESESPGGVQALQREPYADVLASSFASCSLGRAPMDPRAGSLALGFACMSV